MAYPFLYSVAGSVLHKLDQCNLDEFGNRKDIQNDVEMLKGILTHLPSILKTHESVPDFLTIQSSVFGLHDLLNEQLHPSFKSSWSDLVGPLTKFHPQSNEKEENLFSSLSYALPEIESQDVKADNLPLHLVPCLAYCALYPKGYRIVRETLVNLWMAEGFLELKTETAGSSSGSGSGDMELEDVGNRYFMELLSMGVFIKPMFGFGGDSTNQQAAVTIHSCEIHPLMHKLAGEIAQKEVWVIDSQSANELLEPKCTMYIALHQDLQAREWVDRFYPSGIRTCMFFVSDHILRYNLMYSSKLQILDFSGTQFEKLPITPENSGSRLRYLSFSRNTLLERLDNIDWSSIGQLQTLAVDGCVKLEKVNLKHTTHMRHLYYTSKDTNLEVHTSNLRILQLSYCSNLRSISLSNFATFTALRRLRIFECPRLVFLPDSIDQLPRVQELVFHNCARLDLSYGRSMDSLPNLQYMELIGLPKLTELPVGLQSARALSYLMIADCKSLRSMDQVLQHLYPLQKLCVYDCPNLSSTPYVFQSLTALQSLDIRKCPKIAITSTSNAGKDQSPFSYHISGIIIDLHKLLHQTPDLSRENGSGAQTDSFLPINSQFILSMENFPAVNYSKGEEASYAKGSCDSEVGDQGAKFLQGASPDGTLYEKYKLKVPSRWVVLASVMRAIMNMRVLHGQGLYCCLFPSDYEFERDTLVQLWMALGLLPNKWEDLVNKRFNRLLRERCIYNSRTDDFTGIKKYKTNVGMVSALLTSFKSKDHYTLIEDEDTRVDGSTSWNHVSVVSNKIDRKLFKRLEKHSGLRSVLFIRDYGSSLKQLPSTFFTAHPYMQVLDLSGSHISELPSSLGKMTQLRFLDLSFTLIERIPESIHLLQELQTLKLKGCKHLHTLPNGMKDLVNLYHLDFNVLGQLTSMPKRLGSLTKLRTLSAFIVSKEEGCKISELKDMNNLCGSLCISGLECIEGADEAVAMEQAINEVREAAMRKKRHLTRLHLKWNESTCHKRQQVAVANMVLDELKLHESYSLEELHISYSPGSNLPRWIQVLSKSLVSITLVGCEFKTLFTEEKFPKNLKHLNIYDLDRVGRLETRAPRLKSDTKYLRLETLSIDGMLDLHLWTEVEGGEFPCLHKLSIKHCPKLTTIPILTKMVSLRHLEISHCKKLQWQIPTEVSTTLSTLIIDHCPLLKTSFSEDGTYWERIKNVPNIWIDMKKYHSDQDAKDLLSKDESESSDDESD